MVKKTIFFLIAFLMVDSAMLVASDTLIVGYTEGPPFVYNTDSGLTGISVFLWEEIASELNLDFKYENYSFNDLLDSLRTGRVDLSINSLTVTNDRLDFLDFSFPFYSSNSAIAIRTEGWVHSLERFFKPIFTLQFLGAFLLLVFIIVLFGFLVWYVESRGGNEHFRKGFKGIWDGIWWSSVTVTTVGYGDKAPISRMGKVFALMWMFIALIFISSLTAGLTSNFTQSRISKSTSSFQDFKNVNIGTVENSATHEFLKSHFFKNIKLYPDLNVGLVALLGEEVDAFTYDEPIMLYRMDSDDKYENLRILSLRFDNQFYAFGFSKGRDDIIKAINREIINYTETKDWEVILAEYKLGDSNR